MLEVLDNIRDEWNFDGVYTGETTDDRKPHGHGVWIRNDNDKFIGYWD